MSQPTQRSWWGRNWKWLVPLLVGGPLLCCCGGGSLFFLFVVNTLKSSDVYRQALEQARANPEVKDKLGEPIEEGFMVMGQIDLKNAGGTADLTIPISGPKGSGTIHAVATKSAGVWQYTTLQVAVEGSPTRINLLPPP